MMKHYKNKSRVYVVIAASLMLVWSCTDNFGDINSNGTPSEEEAQGNMFNIGQQFTSLQTNIIVCSSTNAYQHNENLACHPYARYLTITKDSWNIQNYGVFNAPINWLNNLFNDQMTNLYPAWFELKKLNDKGEIAPFAWAWAEILRVAAVQRTTDMYGPLPYSKIKEAAGKLYVEYDSQADVYRGMFDDLNAAIITLHNYASSATTASPLKNYDLIYDGDFRKWVRFANSLKLRMAMRIVYADPVKAKQYAYEALDPANGGVIETTDDIAYITREGVTNPLHIMWNDYADTRAAAEIVTYLKGCEDPRLEKYFVPVSNNGGLNDQSYAGMRVGMVVPSHLWACNNFSVPRVAKDAPVLLFSAAEVAFLKAEAAACHGWTSFPIAGTAEEFYHEGIRLSFEQWGISAAGLTTYQTNDVNTQANYSDDSANSASAVSSITVKWDETVSAEVKLERIITQKWIALYPIGLEGWAEYRRTGYPRFFTIPMNRSSDASLTKHGASRIPYGPSEMQNNTDNYKAAVANYLGGRDSYGVRLWWDCKDKTAAGW